MSLLTVSEQPEIAQGYNLEEVRLCIADSSRNVVLAIMQKLMEAHPQQLTFAQIAEKYTLETLDGELSATDEKIRRVYDKLMHATKVTIQVFSKDLVGKTLELIGIQTHDSDAPRKFLGSFVLPESKALLEKLQQEKPGAIEDTEIWKTS